MANIFLINQREQLKDTLRNEPPVKTNETDKLTTDTNEYWSNIEIMINGSNYIMDSCQYLYRLRLKKNGAFVQAYTGHAYCATEAMQADIEVGEEGNSDLFFKYRNKIQYCFIKNPYGYWRVEGNELIFSSFWGREFQRFKVNYFGKSEIRLTTGNYSVTLKKVKY